MKTIKIELAKLRGDSAIRYQSSFKQIEYIETLMKKIGLSDVFRRYFKVNGKNITYHITMKSASALIDALRANKEIQFIEYKPAPKLKEKKIIRHYEPNVKFNSVEKITMNEVEILNNIYELNKDENENKEN